MFGNNNRTNGDRLEDFYGSVERRFNEAKKDLVSVKITAMYGPDKKNPTITNGCVVLEYTTKDAKTQKVIYDFEGSTRPKLMEEHVLNLKTKIEDYCKKNRRVPDSRVIPVSEAIGDSCNRESKWNEIYTGLMLKSSSRK